MTKPPKPDLPSHTPFTKRGEAGGRRGEPGRKDNAPTARSSTGINAEDREPIDPRMPHLPPA